jgi:hypothetical protein
MNSATLKWLAIATVTLLIVMIAVDRTEKSDTVSGGEYLVPGLKERINDISAITVTGAGETESVSITRGGDGWQVKEKDGFAADVGKLRQVLLAIADARKLEQKTANPELYAQLGVAATEAGSGAEPEAGSGAESEAGRGSLIEISGDDSSDDLKYAVIIGNVAQAKNRYVRMADDNQSWLIDKNPELPQSAAGWLASDLLDIDAARIRSVSIRHEDGETLRLEKASAEDTSYSVLGIPEGRELSYATVANGIAGVLKGLTLDDVRRVNAGELSATSVFSTFDGLEISFRRYQDGDTAWIALAAEFVPPDVPPDVPVAASEESAADQAASDDAAVEQPTGESKDDSADAQSGETPEEEAANINARHAGWQYRVPDYKGDLLARRWNDILKAEDEE